MRVLDTLLNLIQRGWRVRQGAATVGGCRLRGLALAIALVFLGTGQAMALIPRIVIKFTNYSSGQWSSTTPEGVCDAMFVEFQGTAGTKVLAQVNENFWTCKFDYGPNGVPTAHFSEYVWRYTKCPDNSVEVGNACDCSVKGHKEDLALGMCVAVPRLEPFTARNKGGAQCNKVDGEGTTNPILPATGEKSRTETDFQDSGPSPLSFVRNYRSTWGADPTKVPGPLGKPWSHSHSTALKATPTTDPKSVVILSPEGYERNFSKAAGVSVWTAGNSADALTQVSGGWVYRRSDDDSAMVFSADGKLLSNTQRNGRSTTYSYNLGGQLATITNSFGRTLTLAYNVAGQLTSVTTPDSRSIGYAYDAVGRLSSVTYPDTKSRIFKYENSTFPQALTGIYDEAGVQFAVFSYDSRGVATSSALAGGVDSYRVDYYSYAVFVLDPLGTTHRYTYGTNQGKLAVTSSSLPSGTGDSDAASRVQDANGLITSETDFKGAITTTTWDVARRLPTTVVRAAGTPEAQTVTTQWHPIFSLPALVTESGRTTAYTYDTLGNTLTETVTDTVTNKVQLWQWTYNAQQLVEDATEPNGAVTHYTYDTRGKVLSVTNHLGHVTSYTYDNANRVLSTTAPNGLVTAYIYDARDRLLTQTVGSGLPSPQTTTFTYKPYGTVEAISLPTGLVLTYTYDNAHRLKGWSNNRGESGSYTLDGMGNRTAEQIKDGAGNVAFTTARTINNLNRLSATTEGANQTSTFAYDANGELNKQTNGLNQSTGYDLDALRRVKTVTDAANASATLKYNALDAVTEAKDFKGVVTGYARDAQGNATAESSVDIGGASTQYDDLGLPSKITDALGQATTIVRDKLGRPTSLVFPDGKTTTLRYDLSATSKGYLSEIVDRSGTTEYTRDAFGRVTLKKQTLANGSVQQVSYGYNLNGTLASIGYPGGGTLAHQYDSTGRLTGLSLNGNPLVSNITWNPLGQPTGWTWAFTSSTPKLAASRSYDTAGRLTATEFSSYVYDAAGRITSLTQNLYGPADTDPTHDTIGNSNTTWTVGYNSVGRITGFNATGNTAGFGYDTNGNRSSSTRTVNGQSTSRTYSVAGNSNQLLGFSQTAGGATTNVSYGYNGNGDLLSDGLRSYGYDAEGRLSTSTTGATDTSPTTRYAHNALGQRVFKTEPLYPPTQGDEADPGFMQSLVAFFTKLWSPSATPAEQQGHAYVYDEQGTLIAEIGSGGTNSAGQASYIYLPTANGPMPIATVINGTTYAVHSDHLNTPRKLSDASGQAVWQWGYSAFGDEEPTTAARRFAGPTSVPSTGTTSIADVTFNLRYPGQYADKESGLFYNYFRNYDNRIGRYTQLDPIGLNGGWNRLGYAEGNPLGYIDPLGLRVPFPIVDDFLRGKLFACLETEKQQWATWLRNTNATPMPQWTESDWYVAQNASSEIAKLAVRQGTLVGQSAGNGSTLNPRSPLTGKGPNYQFKIMAIGLGVQCGCK